MRFLQALPDKYSNKVDFVNSDPAINQHSSRKHGFSVSSAGPIIPYTKQCTGRNHMSHDFNPSLAEEIVAGATIAANVLVSPLTRPWYSAWGSTPDERQRALPGDDIVAAPRLAATRAITIHAPASAVWPWLVQMGQGRGGLYSYQKLENLARCDMHNADAIHPEWQSPAVGDKVRFGPEPYPFQYIRAIDPGRTLVLGSAPEETRTPASWVFHLEPVDDGVRLIVRSRNGYEPGLMNTFVWRVMTDPIFFVMERRMLIGIRDRAEAYHSSIALAA
jgi:hypothetical protein